MPYTTVELAASPAPEFDELRSPAPAAERLIGGMPVSLVSMQDAASTVCDWASKRRARLVVTPNTDHLLRWARSEEFARLYERADLATLDSAVLRYLAMVEGGPVPDRVTGADLFVAAAELAATRGIPLLVIGGRPEVARAAADNLRTSYPGLQMPVILSPDAANLMDPRWLRETAETLQRYPVKIVALCLGSPKQERLFADLQRQSGGLSGVYLCVGAAVDFAAGAVSRAPKVLQDAGLEWLYRLLQEPRRLWRRYLVEDIGVLRYFVAAAADRALAVVRRHPSTEADRALHELPLRVTVSS